MLDHAEPAVALGDHEPILDEVEHRLANRGRRHPEPLAEGGRRIQLAGFEFAGHERRLECPSHLIAEAPAVDDGDVARLVVASGTALLSRLDSLR